MAPAGLLVAVLVAYANAFAGVFQFDDFNVIVQQTGVHSVAAWWQGMPGIRPLLKLSYAANWALDNRALGFHAVNLALHGLNTLLVFQLLRRLAPRIGVEPARVYGAAFVAALIFALHPAQTEAVTYVSGRSVSLMALLALASSLAHLEAEDSRTPSAWRFASAVLFALALAVKENAWVLPLVLLFCGALRGGSGWHKLFARCAWHWAVLLSFAGWVLSDPAYARLLEASLQTRSLAENLLTQVTGVFYLVTHPLLALAVNTDPDLPVHKAFTPELALKACALAGVLAAGVWQARASAGSRWIGFAVLWFALWLIPTNSVLPRLDVANDRQLYLALIGPAFGVGVLLTRLRAHRPSAAKLGAALLVLVLTLATISRNHDYRSEVALWEQTALASPHKPRVWNNLGLARQQADDAAGAERAYRHALLLDPAHWRAKNNLDFMQRATP